MNTNVYMGRKDTGEAAILSSQLKYVFSNGIFITGSADIIPSHKLHMLDNGSLELGYIYSLTDNLEGSISFTKMFYAIKSTRITSSISSEFNASLDYATTMLSPGIEIEYSLGKKGTKNDVFIAPNVSHDFTWNSIFGSQDLLTISPTVELNAGTQHFYSSNFSIKRGKAKKSLQAFKQTMIDIRELDKFNLLDYELSLPVVYSAKPFIISLNPVMALPQNKLPNQITAVQQNKAMLFYYNIGLALKF